MRDIGGRTCFTAIFGDPVEHSLSPVMHNAAYAALELDRVYLAFRVTPELLRDALRAIPALGLAGVNLTVPHKQRALRTVAHLSDEAVALGAINCVVNRRGELHGDNTDARGLELDLRDAGVELEGRAALIVGAGGGATSAVLACLRMGAAHIVLCNRTVRRATQLARRFNHYQLAQGSSRDRIHAQGLDSLAQAATLADAAVVINATPMGLKPTAFVELAYEASPADCLFYDMVYGREPTPFLAAAASAGRRSLDGAGMLLNQGKLAFELFNGVAGPAGVMRTALMTVLGRA